MFQGNTSPLCLDEYLTEVARTPFEVVVVKNDRHNYFLSCKKWAENLEAHRDEVIARWDRHLYRRFVLYLWSAANSFAGEGESFTTLQLQMSYFQPVVSGRLSAHARVIRRGRTTAHLECDLEDAEGGLAARATAVYAMRLK